MKFVKVVQVEKVPEGGVLAVSLDGLELAVAKIDGQFYVFSDTCTHALCNLSQGFLEGKVIECHCHGGKFDVTTGQVLALPPVSPIKTYPVRIENESVLVGLDAET